MATGPTRGKLICSPLPPSPTMINIALLGGDWLEREVEGGDWGGVEGGHAESGRRVAFVSLVVARICTVNLLLADSRHTHKLFPSIDPFL